MLDVGTGVWRCPRRAVPLARCVNSDRAFDAEASRPSPNAKPSHALSRRCYEEGLLTRAEASWTPVPRSVFLTGARPGMHGSELSDIRRFSTFVADTVSTPEESLAILDSLSLPRPEMRPDPHLFCVDTVYWQHVQPELSDLHTSWRHGTGVWQSVGQYMRFQPALVRLADDYLRYLFGTPRDNPLPPFFAVHIRRGGESIPLPFHESRSPPRRPPD